MGFRPLLPLLALAAVLAPAAPAGAGTFEGRLEIRHSDDFAKRESSTRYALVRAGRRYRLVPTRTPAVAAGRRVVVRGRRTGNTIRGRVTPARAHAAYHTISLGARKTAVLLFNFTSDTREPWTPAQVRQRVFTDADSSNGFYKEQSYDQVELVGKLQPDGDVYGWHTIAASPSVCDVNVWTPQARSAATAAGADLSGYDHIIYVFPEQQSCGWAGLGELGASQSWINGDISVRVVAHELGHNMGLHHASSYSCTSAGAPVAISSSCTQSEYGDPFDVMGCCTSRHSHAWHLQKLGYIAASDVQTITTSGTYTVRSAISQSADVQLLRVSRAGTPLGGPGQYYYLELRTAGGVFDSFLSTNPVVQGVSIRAMGEPTPHPFIQTRLLDATPGSASGFLDAALPVGQTFSDGTISITTTAVDGPTATVEVSMADVLAPARPGNLRSVLTPGGARLSWDPSSDNIAVTGYKIYRDGVEIGSTPGIAYDVSAPAGSAHSYEVQAYDAAGNRSTRSTAHTVSVPAPPPAAPEPPPPSPPPAADVTAPVVRLARLPRTARARRAMVVTASALDEGGIARLELRIDGVRRRVVAASQLTYRWKLPHRGRRAHRIEVRAWDTSWNVGTTSARLKR